ncbi:MAG: hypothetical protein KH359_00020 [Clostridiales bacterium]|nr:hypothetical protein [Clostridiales bacterium]
MDSTTLSVIAIVISIGVPVFEYFYNRSFTNVNLDAQYFDAVYKDYLLVKIPEVRLKIQRNSAGEVLGIDEFVELLREIRKKSLYFKFAHEEFYMEVLEAIQKLEDELVLVSTKLTNEEFGEFQHKIDVKVHDIYSCINDASHGRKML